MSVPGLSDNQIYALKPQAIDLFDHLQTVGSASAREVFLDMDMTSATLASRICDLEKVGITILRQVRRHPATNRRYTRYVLHANDPKKMLPSFLTKAPGVHVEA